MRDCDNRSRLWCKSKNLIGIKGDTYKRRGHHGVFFFISISQNPEQSADEDEEKKSDDSEGEG